MHLSQLLTMLFSYFFKPTSHFDAETQFKYLPHYFLHKKNVPKTQTDVPGSRLNFSHKARTLGVSDYAYARDRENRKQRLPETFKTLDL